MPARQRILEIVLQSPRRTLIVALILAVAALYPVSKLDISTSRKALVSPDHPVQANLMRFQSRFASTDIPILVAQGGEEKARRDALSDTCQQIQRALELTEAKVFCRITPSKLAPIALSQSWDLTGGLIEATEDIESMDSFVSEGWEAWFPFVARRARTAVMQTQLSLFEPDQAREKLDNAYDLLSALEGGSRALEAHSRREDPFSDLLDSPPEGIDRAGFLTSPDGQALLAPLLIEFESDEIGSFRPTIEAIRGVLTEVSAKSSKDVSLGVTGIPALNVDEYRSIERGLWQSSIATTLGILCLFWLGFRSIGTILIAFIPLGLGVILTLSGTQMHFGGLNLITSSFISILLGLGIDLPVHWLSRVRESQQDGQSVKAAIKDAQINAGRGIITGTLTTTLCFLTLARSEFTAFAELGIITALGLILMLATTFTLLPAAQVLLPGRPSLNETTWFSNLLTKYTEFVVRNPKVILGLGLILSIAGISVFKDLGFHYRYLDFVPKDTESARLLAKFEESKSSGVNQATVEVSSIEEGRRLSQQLKTLKTVASVSGLHDFYFEPTPERISTLKKFFEKFQAPTDIPLKPIPSFSNVELYETTISQLIKSARFGSLLASRLAPDTQTQWKELEQALNARLENVRSRQADYAASLQVLSQHTESYLRRALEPLQKLNKTGDWHGVTPPNHLAHRYQSKDQESVALVVTPQEDIWQGASAARFIEEVKLKAPQIAGFATMLYEHSKMVISGFQLGALIASLLVIALLWFDFRSLRDALTCLLPLMMGWCWMFVGMQVFGLELNVANIVVLPLILGIGVDTSVHIMHRVREEERLHTQASLSIVILGTGRAVLFAALTTMVGFAGLTVADNGAMKSLGFLMVLAILSTLGSSLIVLPAWLSLRRVKL